ncbi:MAG: DUF932 domain-containing protein [Candidatus Kariarchaeaceae archaeon]
MNTETTRKLWKFLFPVAETEVQIKNMDSLYFPTKDYKAIIREDNSKLIAIQKKSYKLVSNAEVIEPVLSQLDDLTTDWLIDDSHSFVENNRMRLQVTFPELVLNDGRSDIAMSMFIHNSYDGTEGVRMYWGAIRGICSNGMVFGEVLAKFYSKHTSGIVIDNLKKQIEDTYDQIPVIKERIEILQNLEVTDELNENIADKLGKGIGDYVDEQEAPENQWKLYNYLTYYISHVVQQRMRASYQLKVSKLFQL